MARLKFAKEKVSNLNKGESSVESAEDFFDDANAPVQEQSEDETQPHKVEAEAPVNSESETTPAENVETHENESHEDEHVAHQEHVEDENKEQQEEKNKDTNEKKPENKYEVGENDIFDNGDTFEGEYVGNKMPSNDEFDDLRDLAASERAKISMEKEMEDKNLSETVEQIQQNFKYLPDEDKEILIKNLMKKDKNLGEILEKLVKENGSENEHEANNEHAEEHPEQTEQESEGKPTEEAEDKPIENNEEKPTEEAEEKPTENNEEKPKAEDEEKPKETEEEKEHDSSEKKPEEEERSNPEQNDRINNDIENEDINTGNSSRLDKIRIPDRATVSDNSSQNNVNTNSQVYSSGGGFSLGKKGGDVNAIRDSIARKNYNRTIKDISDCIDTTQTYNSDVYNYNSQARTLGVLDIQNDRTLTEDQKNAKLRDIYKNNPDFLSLAKRIESNGKKIPYLHEKISDGLDESFRLGMNVQDAEDSYKDLLASSRNLDKPLASPPKMKLEEIAKKIAEAIRNALTRFHNVFVKKEARAPESGNTPK